MDKKSELAAYFLHKVEPIADIQIFRSSHVFTVSAKNQ